jgi:hypothetical protein
VHDPLVETIEERTKDIFYPTAAMPLPHVHAEVRRASLSKRFPRASQQEIRNKLMYALSTSIADLQV